MPKLGSTPSSRVPTLGVGSSICKLELQKLAKTKLPINSDKQGNQADRFGDTDDQGNRADRFGDTDEQGNRVDGFGEADEQGNRADSLETLKSFATRQTYFETPMSRATVPMKPLQSR